MLRRVAQPPIAPDARSREEHDFWPAFGLILAGICLVVFGVRHVTALDTAEGAAARELQLMKAFSNGGLEWSDPAALPDPRAYEDPAQVAAALERWEQEQARGRGGWNRLRYVVNTDAAAPCPT